MKTNGLVACFGGSSVATFLLLLHVFASLFVNAAVLQYRGVNEAGAEFGSNLPGTYNVDYVYPTTASIDYFVSKGMNTFRVNFLWERLQRSQNAAFDSTEQGRLTSIVNYITNTKGAYALIDPHNYARYFGQVVGTSVPSSAFCDFWVKLANLFKGNSKVIFGLMNEPNSMSTETWRDDAQAAINCIRQQSGATNLILVPGNGWTGAHSWTANSYGTPNSQAMLSITDPSNNFAFEVHQYLDGDSSGQSATCVSSTIGSERLAVCCHCHCHFHCHCCCCCCCCCCVVGLDG